MSAICATGASKGSRALTSPGGGPLAGPLVAAAAILPEGFDLNGIRDSKQLTQKQRVEAYEHIIAGAITTVCWAEPHTIVRNGLDGCNLRLLRRAVYKLDPEPDYVLIDGSVPVPFMRFRSVTIAKETRRQRALPLRRLWRR